MLYVLADYFLLLFTSEFFNIRHRYILFISTGLALLFYLYMIWIPSGNHFVAYGAPFTASVILLLISTAIGIYGTALYRDPLRYWPAILFVILVLVSVSNTLRSLFTGQVYLLSFTFLFRLPLLLLGIVIIYILDLVNIRKERDSLTKALLKKTDELQREKKKSPGREDKTGPRDAIYDLIDYLDHNYSETYDRIALAKKFGINDHYMLHLFKKVTRTNIANYINRKRIEAAMRLLRDTESKVIDIAFHVGFDNLTYFYRHFKKHTGLSPLEYRKKEFGLSGGNN
jgi:two-component system response regulator YesN